MPAAPLGATTTSNPALPTAPPPPPEQVSAPPPYPLQPLNHLDALWIQVAGTLCNLRCTHCFVSSGPGDDHHPMMSRDEVRERVAEGLALGVKEFYFTGGEPFVHPSMIEILEDTLAHGPCTVLTNGTRFTPHRLAELLRLSDSGRYSLEVRVSLDGYRAVDHERFRGPGSFDRALAGLRALAHHGLLPIVSITQNNDEDPLAVRERYARMLSREAGIARARLKILPMFHLGRETRRTRAYDPIESLAGLPPEQFDPSRLQCSSARAVTGRGVFVCPLLVDEPRARMGDRVVDTLTPFELCHGACYTCHVTGMTCGNN